MSVRSIRSFCRVVPRLLDDSRAYSRCLSVNRLNKAVCIDSRSGSTYQPYLLSFSNIHWKLRHRPLDRLWECVAC